MQQRAHPVGIRSNGGVEQRQFPIYHLLDVGVDRAALSGQFAMSTKRL
ncbi:hypothetical protein [Blastococcus colisei]|nr:hypothetical protein [Blastococcus colisei]